MSKKSTFSSLPGKARAAIIGFGIIGAVLVINAIDQMTATDPATTALFLLMAAVTSDAKVRLIGGSSLSLLTSVVLLALFTLGTPVAVLVAVFGVTVQCSFPRSRFIPHHAVFNIGMISITVWLSGVGYEAFGSALTTPDFANQLIGTLLASLYYFLGNSICVSLIVSLSSGKSPRKLWHDNFLYTAPSFFLAGLISFTSLRLFATYRVSTIFVVGAILYLSYSSYRVYMDSLEKENKHAREMAELYKSTLSTLAFAIDAKDRNTHGHIVRVQMYAREIAREMKLEAAEVEALAALALLHDIGKLAVPEYILRKTAVLTPEETKKMQLHPQIGAEIIANIKFAYPVADCVLSHHERFDGSGYPRGLRGSDIPLGARILAVVDVFDAVVSKQHSNAEIVDRAIGELRKGSGTSFDPEIVDTWTRICRDAIRQLEKSGELRHTQALTVYTDIHRATWEINTLETIAESISGLSTTQDIAVSVERALWRAIPGCVATLHTPALQVKAQRDKSNLVVAVTSGGNTIGSLVLHRNEPLNEDEARLVMAVAETIASPLNNAVVLEIARREAMRDKLTGLANRRAFETLFERLGGEEFSIVLIDVDAFKSINDTFGHEAGDTTLIRIASHLQAAFTDARLICRLGGDEFVVVSPWPKPFVRKQARAFRRFVIWDPGHEDYRRLRFDVSFGIATVPAEASRREDALRLADQRMYALKSRHKQWKSRRRDAELRDIRLA